jgi:hypothetical protein
MFSIYNKHKQSLKNSLNINISRNRKSLCEQEYQWETCAWWCIMMSLVRGRMGNKHTLKSSSGVWSRDPFLRIILFIAEQPASHRYDVEKGIAFFVSCRRDNQNEAISVDECFSFGLLSSLISVSSSSSATVNSADSNALHTNGSLSPSPRKIYQMTGNTFQCFFFLLCCDRLCRIVLFSL